MVKKANVVHDTRGRKIISVDKAKKELISGYTIALIITTFIRMILGESINIEFESMDDYLRPTIIYAMLDGLMFAVTWIITYKFFMNKYTFRGIEKLSYNSTMVLVNICVCIYIAVSFMTSVNDSITELETKYDQIKRMASSYSSLYNIDAEIDAMDVLMDDYKDKFHTIGLVKIALSICGNFLGWAMVKKDVENMYLDEDEYKTCMNIEDGDRGYTTNRVPEEEIVIPGADEPITNSFTTLDNLR
jgi:hypothetical protein